MLYSDFKSQVICDSELTEAFNVSTGVKQGCILSPFNGEVEIRARLAKASQAFASLRSTWKARNIRLKTK